MTSKELRRLSRKELVELLLEQTKRVDTLLEEIENLKKQIESKDISTKSAGSIAEASLQLAGVFEAAQKAADIYLDNIKKRESEMIELYKELNQKAKDDYNNAAPADDFSGGTGDGVE